MWIYQRERLFDSWAWGRNVYTSVCSRRCRHGLDGCCWAPVWALLLELFFSPPATLWNRLKLLRNANIKSIKQNRMVGFSVLSHKSIKGCYTCSCCHSKWAQSRIYFAHQLEQNCECTTAQANVRLSLRWELNLDPNGWCLQVKPVCAAE